MNPRKANVSYLSSHLNEAWTYNISISTHLATTNKQLKLKAN